MDQGFSVIADADCESLVESSWHAPHTDHFAVDATTVLSECKNDEQPIEKSVAAGDNDVD